MLLRDLTRRRRRHLHGKGNQVRVGVNWPVHREEIYLCIQREKSPVDRGNRVIGSEQGVTSALLFVYFAPNERALPPKNARSPWSAHWYISQCFQSNDDPRAG